MRTLQLTHEEISTLTRALGIAEKQMYKMRKKYLSDLVNIRGSEEKYREEADIFHALSNKFAELCMDIEMGNKDV